MADSEDLFKRIQRFFEKESRRTKWTRHGVRVCATVVFPIMLGVLIKLVLENDESFWLWLIFGLLIGAQVGFAYLTTIHWKGAPTYYDFEQLQRDHENEVEQLQHSYEKEKQDVQERFDRTEANFDRTLQMQEALNYATAMLGRAETLVSEDGEQANDLEQVIALVLGLCVSLRAEIFGFRSEDFYNFAVYLYDSDVENLHVAWRECDPRIQRQDRRWVPGDGHVGLCFVRKRVLFSNNVPQSDELERDEPGDDEKYVSMVSIPIFRSGDFPDNHSGSSDVNHDAEPLGVFVVTSSAPNQFDEELHKSFLLSLSFHLSFVIERVLDRPESTSP